MAHSLSANKRIRQNETHRARNRWRTRRYRLAVTTYKETILHGSIEQAEKELQGLYKLIDQVASTPAMHKKTASRYKSGLATQLNTRKKSTAASV